MLYNSPKRLINAVSKLMNESKAKYDQEQKEFAEAQKALWEKKMGKKPLHPNQQKLDVHEPEKDELTAKDFEMLRAGKKAMKKEEVEQTNEAQTSAAARLAKAKMKTSHQAATTMKHISNPTPGEKKAAKDIKPGIAGYRDRIDMLKSAQARGALKKEEVEQVNEKNKDTPGQHMCAVHVKNEQLGEGKTIPGQHAEPDSEGYIAWYDVMFKECIVREVPTSELEILVSEAHKNHRKMKMEHNDIDEARGRPRKTPAPMGSDKEGEEPDQNIVNHLKKSVDTNGNHEIKFSDGKKHKVPGHVAKKVLGAMGKLKPDDRLEIQKHIQQSHSNLMQVHGMIK